MTVVTTTPPKRQSKYERSRRCPRKLRKVSGGLGLRLIQCLCLCPALGCERLKSLRCHRVEYASRQPFGTGSLLLQILKLGHDPALIFQDNLRRMRSFRRCTGLSECEVKSVRRITLPWVSGAGSGRAKGEMDKYGALAVPVRAPTNSLGGRRHYP